MSEGQSLSNIGTDPSKDSRDLQEDDDDDSQLPENPNPSPLFSMLITHLMKPLSEDLKDYCVSLRKGPKEVRNFIIMRFFKTWREKVGPNLYPALRLIMPTLDRDRPVYGLKEKAIASILIKLMTIPKTSRDAKQLMDFKSATRAAATTTTTRSSSLEFSTICSAMVAKRSTNVNFSKLTVDDVNSILNELTAATGLKDQTEVLVKFYSVMNPEELRWIIQIILKDVRIGCGDKVILDNFHADAYAYFNVTSSLKKVCAQLYDPNYRLPDEVNQITLMSCFQPQLAQYVKPNAQTIVELMISSGAHDDEDHDGFFMEEKMDGERIQIHISDYGKQIKAFSRSAKDYTYLYGSSFDDTNGSIVKHLKDVFSPKMRNCILDGEMVVWDSKENMIVPFGTLKTAAISVQRSGMASVWHPLYMVFDILLVNDKLLVDYSLKDRRAALSAILTPKPGYVEILPYTTGRTAQDISTLFEKVMDRGGEGLIIKDPKTRYIVSERSKAWIKLKPDYVDGLGETFDVCIIGGYYGNGKRLGSLGSFLCGLRVNDNEEKFISFCKVGGGFSSQEFGIIGNITADKWHKYNRDKPPTEYMDVGSQIPDVWIKPSESIVVEVKGAQLVDSDTFAAKKTLRFPRFLRFRHDEKDWTTSMSVEDLDELAFELMDDKAEKERESSSSAALETVAVSTKRSSSTTLRSNPRKKQRINKSIYGDNEDLESVTRESDLFNDLVFLVPDRVSEPRRMSKNELEVLLKKNGGKIVQSLKSASSPIVIADRHLLQVVSILKQATAVVVRPSWVFDSISNGTLAALDTHRLALNKAESPITRLKMEGNKMKSESADEMSEHIGVLNVSSAQNVKEEPPEEPIEVAAIPAPELEKKGDQASFEQEDAASDLFSPNMDDDIEEYRSEDINTADATDDSTDSIEDISDVTDDEIEDKIEDKSDTTDDEIYDKIDKDIPNKVEEHKSDKDESVRSKKSDKRSPDFLLVETTEDGHLASDVSDPSDATADEIDDDN